MRRFPQSPELGSAHAEIQEKRATATAGCSISGEAAR
jgi:hypothetical protein